MRARYPKITEADNTYKCAVLITEIFKIFNTIILVKGYLSEIDSYQDRPKIQVYRFTVVTQMENDAANVDTPNSSS